MDARIVPGRVAAPNPMPNASAIIPDKLRTISPLLGLAVVDPPDLPRTTLPTDLQPANVPVGHEEQMKTAWTPDDTLDLAAGGAGCRHRDHRVAFCTGRAVCPKARLRVIVR